MESGTEGVRVGGEAFTVVGPGENGTVVVTGAMLKLLAVMHFRKYSYEKTIFSLTESDIWDLGFVDSWDQEILPSPSTLHPFVKYRLGVTGIKEVMKRIGKKFSGLLKPGIATTDSTPMDASR